MMAFSGRPQFVAHVGEELALDTGGLGLRHVADNLCIGTANFFLNPLPLLDLFLQGDIRLCKFGGAILDAAFESLIEANEFPSPP